MGEDRKPAKRGRGPAVDVTHPRAGRTWKLQEAKARFSEVVRRAQSEGPQRVTVRGADAAFVVSPADLSRLLPQTNRVPFIEFMESLYVEGLDLARESDRGRDIEL